MKDLVVALIGVEGAQGLGKLFLEEKCFQRRGGPSNHNFVVSGMVTYRISPVEIIVGSSPNWITKSVLSADAYIFVYNAKKPATMHKLKDEIIRFIVQKGTDRFPSVLCELYEGSNHRIVPALSGKHLAEDFGFKFLQADTDKGSVRPLFKELVTVYRRIVDIETRIRRKRIQERQKMMSSKDGVLGDEIMLFIAAIVIVVVLLGLLIYSLAYHSNPIYNTRAVSKGGSALLVLLLISSFARAWLGGGL
mmetsp:Transcript_44720/g.71847  ORF Transcript_44720/g.71847 Transcript_44720/m.71847 type:complete len:249 (+) Transcript_44720:180-926(+)